MFSKVSWQRKSEGHFLFDIAEEGRVFVSVFFFEPTLSDEKKMWVFFWEGICVLNWWSVIWVLKKYSFFIIRVDDLYLDLRVVHLAPVLAILPPRCVGMPAVPAALPHHENAKFCFSASAPLLDQEIFSLSLKRSCLSRQLKTFFFFWTDSIRRKKNVGFFFGRGVCGWERNEGMKKKLS